MNIKVIDSLKILFLGLLLIVLVLPVSYVLAQESGGSAPSEKPAAVNTGTAGGESRNNAGEATNSRTSDGDTSNQATSVKLKNPLKIGTVEGLLTSVLSVVVILALPLIVFFIIYSGFLYVTARGNAAQIEQATKSLTYAIIGGVLVIGAVAIAEIIKNLVSSFTA